MPRTTTLVNLRSEVRARADIEGDPHITDAEVTRFINQSAAALQAACIDLDEGFSLSQATVNTVAGTATYQLDNSSYPGFYKLLHIEVQVGGIWRSLRRWTFEDRTLYLNSASWGAQLQPISYRLSFDTASGYPTITLAPTPDGAYPVTIYYAKSWTDLVNDSDTYAGGDGWEEWVVLDAAIKCATKDESDPSTLIHERDQVWQRIKAQFTSMDLDRPDKVRDVEFAQNIGTFRYQVPT